MKTLLISILVFRTLGSFSQTVTDYDGNEYNTVHIGNQDWLRENLRSIHYSDGTEAAFMKYKDSDEGVEVYGLLYTWDAAMHDSTEEGVQGICPCGWHVPTRQDWNDLFGYLGGADVAGRPLKEAGNDHWNLPNTGDNSTGFTATGAGFYNSDPLFTIGYHQRGNILGLWTSTPSAVAGKAVQFAIQNSTDDVEMHDWVRTDAYSIRCIKDASVPDGIEEDGASIPEY